MCPSYRSGRPAFAVFTETVCDGLIPAWHDQHGVPVIYATEREAEVEIAKMIIDNLEEFLAGQRDFDDARLCSDFILPVFVLPNGTFYTADGGFFGVKAH